MKKNSINLISRFFLIPILFFLNVIYIQAASNTPYIGINLAWVTDWTGDKLFADAWKTVRPEWYKTGHWGDDKFKAATDQNGWPIEDAELVAWDLANMNGTFALSFTGQATITPGWSGGSITNQVYNSSTNRTTATFTRNTNQTALLMSFTNTNGKGVKDIKLMRPTSNGANTSYDESVTFTNDIKNLISKFQVIRTMDPQSTNGSQDKNWADRALKTQATLNTEKGIPWEYIIQLANETNKDIWIQIPHKATDAYITSLAELLFSTLNNKSKVYIEYSNEVWNTASGFPQGNEINQMAKDEVAKGNSPLNYDGEENSWVWVWRYVGKRTVEISNIFRQKFGDNEMMTRIRPVLEWQQADGQGTGSAICNFIFKYYGSSKSVSNPHSLSYYVYGGGGSAYYSPDVSSRTLSLEDIWKSENFDTNYWKSSLKKDADICATYGIKRTAYEGGPSLDGNDINVSVKEASVNDSRMTSCVIEHQTTWDSYGGDLLVYYKSTGDYQWGFSDNSSNLNTKKFDAINTINSTTKSPVSYGVAIPATVNGNTKSFDYGNYGYDNGTSTHLKEHMGAAYVFRVVTPGNYNVSANLNGKGTVTFYCDGKLLGSQVVGNGNTSTFTMANLEAGLHGVIIESSDNSGDGFDILSVNYQNGLGTITPITGLDIKQNLSLSLYPNPVSDILTLNFNAMFENADISILDLNGRTLQKQHISNTITNEIDVQQLKSGLYFLKINNKGLITITKFVKK